MQPIRFLLVGMLNTAIGLGSIYAVMGVLDYRLANAVGYIIGCAVSFLLNRSWTFCHRGPVWSSLVRWLVVIGVAYGLNLATVVLLHAAVGISAYLAQIGGIGVYTATSYAGARYFAFPARVTPVKAAWQRQPTETGVSS